MPLSEEQKKELKKMNSASFVYGASKMEDEELDSLSAAPEAVMQEENAEQLRSEKLIEMMLVDTESAEKLKEAFPDLYEKARAKEANLNRQAEVSGMDKVKHDFFGSKRKAAKASLADLKSKRDVLENKKAFDRAGASATEALQTRRQELERKKAELAANVDREDPKYQLRLYHIDMAMDRIDAELGGTATYAKSSIMTIDALTKTTDSFIEGQARQGEFISGSYVVNRNGNYIPYQANGRYRDMCYFTTALKSEDQAKLDDMIECADAVYVMQTGCHSDAGYSEVDGKMTQEKASVEDQYAAFNKINDYALMTYREMKDFETDHPKLFTDNPDPKEVLEDFEELNALFRKAQCSNIITNNTVLKSDFFKKTLRLSAKTDFINMTRYISSMSVFTLRIVEWIMGYARFMQGTGPDPGAFNPELTLKAHYDKWKPQD